MIKLGAIPKEEITAANVEDMKSRFTRSNKDRIGFKVNPLRNRGDQPSSSQQIVTKKYDKNMRDLVSVEQQLYLDHCEAVAKTTTAKIFRHKKW